MENRKWEIGNKKWGIREVAVQRGNIVELDQKGRKTHYYT